MWGEKKELEKRPDNEPKFSIKNKTDRYILIFVVVTCLVIIAIIVTLLCVYFLL